MIAYFKVLTKIDWLHHIVMVFIAGPLVCMQIPTPVINAVHVFMIGVPGRIDYSMLAGVKMGYISGSTEKLINTKINVWLRSPGIIWISGSIYAS